MMHTCRGMAFYGRNGLDDNSNFSNSEAYKEPFYQPGDDYNGTKRYYGIHCITVY